MNLYTWPLHLMAVTALLRVFNHSPPYCYVTDSLLVPRLQCESKNCPEMARLAERLGSSEGHCGVDGTKLSCETHYAVHLKYEMNGHAQHTILEAGRNRTLAQQMMKKGAVTCRRRGRHITPGSAHFTCCLLLAIMMKHMDSVISTTVFKRILRIVICQLILTVPLLSMYSVFMSEIACVYGLFGLTIYIWNI
jgi:hypothetical protein